MQFYGSPGGTVIKNPPANAGEMWVRSLGWEDPLEKENGNPLQYFFFLGSPMDRGDWQATVHGGRKELDMTEHICTHVHPLNSFLPTEPKSVCTGLMTQKPIPGGIAKCDC